MVARREMLVPTSDVRMAGGKPGHEAEVPSGKKRRRFSGNVEIRPVWVLELSLNNPDYIYSKRVMWFDAVPLEENGSFCPYWGENYDQAGRLWRANGPLALGTNPLGWDNLFGWLFMDAQKNHYTLMNGYGPFSQKGVQAVLPIRRREGFYHPGTFERSTLTARELKISREGEFFPFLSLPGNYGWWWAGMFSILR